MKGVEEILLLGVSTAFVEIDPEEGYEANPFERCGRVIMPQRDAIEINTFSEMPSSAIAAASRCRINH